MFAATVSKLALQAQKGAPIVRNMSVQSGPPTVKVSTAEKAVHGVCIVAGITAIPMWVLVNIKNYRNPK